MSEHDESVTSNEVFAMVRTPAIDVLIVGLLVVGATPATVGTTVGEGVRVEVGVLVNVGVNEAVNVGVTVGVREGVNVCVEVNVGVLVGSTLVMVYTAPSNLTEPSHVGSPST